MTDITTCFITQRLVPRITRQTLPVAPAAVNVGRAERPVSGDVRHRLTRTLHRLVEIIQPDGSIATIPLRATR